MYIQHKYIYTRISTIRKTHPSTDLTAEIEVGDGKCNFSTYPVGLATDLGLNRDDDGLEYLKIS